MATIRERTVRGVSPNGVLGDSRGASAAQGQALLECMGDELCEAVARWLR
jgi:creatinine amidohydrolase